MHTLLGAAALRRLRALGYQHVGPADELDAGDSTAVRARLLRDLEKMIAEFRGEATGYTKASGGSMHLVDPSCGVVGDRF